MNNYDLNQIDINNTKFYSFLLSLFSIEGAKDKLTAYYNDDNNKKIFQLLYDFFLNKNINDKMKKYFIDSIKSNNFKLIIEDIFDKIDSGLSQENNNDFENSQLYIYDEDKSKEKFLKKNKNPSTIKKLFFLSKETITLCKECNLNTYNFNYAKFFLIDLDKEKNNISLSDKILESEEIQSKEKCSFCTGKLTDCIKKEKIIDYPEILIVILEGKKFNNFTLEYNNEILCNNRLNILYNLVSFIDSGTDCVYIQEKNNWYKCTENNKKKIEDYWKKNPVVLFYKLTDRKYINQIINGEKVNNNLKNTENYFKNDFIPQTNIQGNKINNKMLQNSVNVNSNLYNNCNSVNNIYNNNFNNTNKINNFNNNLNYSASNIFNFMNFNQNNLNNNINTNNQKNFQNYNNNFFSGRNENYAMNNRYSINNNFNLNETQKTLEQSNNKLISSNKELENKIKELKKENSDLKKENSNMKKEIGDLKEKLNNEKNDNKNLNLKIKELEDLLKKEKEYNLQIKNENNNGNNGGKLLELYEEIRLKDIEIREKNKEIQKLNERISRFPFELSENEQLMSVIFISTDQNIHYSIICKNTDQFTKVETKLYKEFPRYEDIENVFVVNGRKINKYKSLKDNNVKNNDIIQLNPIE